MSRVREILMVCIPALCTVLLLITPVYAVNTAIYGSTAGLNLSAHQDEFVISCSLPGLAGSELDQDISCFTNTSTDVIILGGDAGFSGTTESNIINATSSGKILVVNGSDMARFSDILPVQSAGTEPGSPGLIASNTNTTFSADIFAGLPLQYTNQTAISGREGYVLRTGSISLLSFENGDPALAFSPYGNGYVVAWIPPADLAYLNSTDADLINERLITRLLALRAVVPRIGSNTTTPSLTATQTTVTPAPEIAASTGNATISSAPEGANVFIDDVYEGITPVNLTGFSSGTHSLKLELNGYADYDATIQITGGNTTSLSRTLVQRIRTIQSTAAPAPVTTDTSSPWSSPSVVAAVAGSIAAVIGAVATIFSMYRKHP